MAQNSSAPPDKAKAKPAEPKRQVNNSRGAQPATAVEDNYSVALKQSYQAQDQ